MPSSTYADRIASLPADKRRLLAHRLSEQLATSTPQPVEPNDHRLIAYLVPTPDESLTVSELRQFLNQKLPDYMVPAAFVQLDTLPVTPNGKVDRDALPAPTGDRPELEKPYTAPRTTVETTLAAIWSDLLGIEQVGVHDNFFDLGGHSLLALRLTTEIEQQLDQPLPLFMVFQRPTIAQLAHAMTESDSAKTWSSLVPIQVGEEKPPLFCIHTVSGGLHFYYDLAQYFAPEQPIYGLQPLGLDGQTEHHTRIEAMAAHYIDEIRELRPDGPYWLSGYSFGGIIAFEMAHQLRQQGHQVELILFDTYFPQPEALATKVARHKTAVSGLGLGRKLSYFSKRGVRKAVMLADRANRKRKQWWEAMPVYRHHLRRQPLPVHLQSVYFKQLCYRALRYYVPRVYPGRIILFRQLRPSRLTRDLPDLGWRPLAGGGLTIEDIPGGHGDMLKEPYVQLLVQKLNRHMAAPSV